MTLSDKKRELLAKDVWCQNEEPDIKCLREFMKLSHFLDKFIDKKLDTYGLNRTQRRIIIFILTKNKSMTPTELAKRSHLTIDTVNKSIDNLDNMGMTKSHRSTTDRRVRNVSLTEKGIEMVEKLMPIRTELFSQIMSCFNEKEVPDLFGYIKRFTEHLECLMEQDGAPPAAPS